MKLTARRKVLTLGTAFALTAVPSFAILGVGDIVFDPTSYASLVSQATTALNQLRTMENNVVHFSAKDEWHTTLNRLETLNVANMFGETVGFSTALTSNSPSAAVRAWRTSTVATDGNATTYLQHQPAGSPQRAQLAMIETSDATSPMCLNAVGAYRAAASGNTGAEQALQQQQLDGGSETNSEVEQLNLLNASEAQHMIELKQQGMLQACLAQQMAVGSMQQRNAAAEDLNTWGAVEQQRSTNNVNPADSSTTWTTYLP